jgi:hypothetical protein|tara:strand:- start:144 stop:407 length:264 start_codon:yes stop_codon:yes gene_type:complete
METETQTQTETINSMETSITLNDLVLLRNIVNVASKRGAFSAEEFSDIGAVYNKIDKFLKLNLKKMEDSEEKESTETTVETENKIEI